MPLDSECGTQALQEIPLILPTQTFAWFNEKSIQAIDREQLKPILFGYNNHMIEHCEQQYLDIRGTRMYKAI